MYDNSVYVGYDNFTSTGHSNFRERILKKLKEIKGFDFIKLNELKFNKIPTEELKLEYLKEIGLFQDS